MTFELGVNAFADLTEEEYRQMLGYRGAKQGSEQSFVATEGFEAPTEVDWVTKGYVTPIKNQVRRVDNYYDCSEIPTSKEMIFRRNCDASQPLMFVCLFVAEVAGFLS